MANFNKVILVGNLTKDPELRYTPQGTAVANLRMAINRRYRDRSQNLKEESCFVTVVVWNKQAESSNQYLRKGSPVLVEGSLQSRSWEDNSGQKRNVLEVRAQRVQFLGSPVAREMTGSVQEQHVTENIEESTESSWLEEEPKEEENVN
ncbi:MAG: single-stranded DNA-binding protein [Candidatus Omnitrophota bacterium]|nr:MAG: single-stranded DNA-binding protein [Candidatus Omnitrophota bacterium]